MLVEKPVAYECNGQQFTSRPDDNPETMKTRLKTFREQTAPIRYRSFLQSHPTQPLHLRR